LGQDNSHGEELIFNHRREENFKILWSVGFASSLTKHQIRVCLWGFGNVIAKIVVY
jgi:hypothetical protein